MIQRSAAAGLAIVVWAACAARESAPARGEPTEPYGWYELEPGRRVFITWGPTGGYRMFDFAGAKFGALAANDSGVYEWRTAEESSRLQVHFQRDDSDAPAFVWRDRNGRTGSAHAAEEYPYDQEAVRFTSDGAELHGTLLIPRVRKLVGTPGRMREVPLQLPAVVMIHGSGTSDRDNVWAYAIAQHIARQDVMVLIPDKRGSGASGGDWQTADFDQLARDALAGVRLVRADARADAQRVGLLGLSQGGWIAPIAAAQDTGIAFIIDVSGAAVSVFEQIRHEAEQDLRRAGLRDADVATLLELQELSLRWARDGAPATFERYSAARNALLAGSLEPVVRSFPADTINGLLAWLHRVGDVDPIPYWQRFRGRALVVYGEADEQDNVPVAESVRRLLATGLPTFTICVFPQTGHTLTDASTGWLSADVLETLARWTSAVTAEPAHGASARVREARTDCLP